MHRVVFAFTLALLLSGQAGAVTMHICTGETPPYSTGAASGTADRLILQAAKEVGLTIEYHSAPLARCREEIRLNLSDGFPAAPYSKLSSGYCVFPMKGSDPDIERAVLIRRTLVFRRIGSKAEWSGTEFSELTTPVLVQFGAYLQRDNLKAIGAQVDDSGRSVEVNFAKMLAGRADLAVAPEQSGLAMLEAPSYAGKIEALPIPFSNQAYYLIVSKRFYEANSELMQKLWDAMGRIRRSQEQIAQRKTTRRR
ncbi:hypothetical protein GTP46_26945 [Duganella sp. FT135W]|uniref:Transporter substrate-binding domain-containing protein n=1 Tax=Duganella flavida TaxID=2692175 RepID=A0A6L8KFQ2_9BURK|nr:hypothetical protein [Duganella flavida]MYM26273.1 hypothetical protein [Duganella flavida]